MSDGKPALDDTERGGASRLPDHILSVVNDTSRLRVVEAVTQSQTTLTVTATNDDACVTEDVALSWVRTETDIVSGGRKR